MGLHKHSPRLRHMISPPWSIFSDGVYPASYPLNLTPPQTLLQQVSNTGRQYQLTPQQLAVAKNQVNLINHE